jgi:hypothetical protein
VHLLGFDLMPRNATYTAFREVGWSALPDERP